MKKFLRFTKKAAKWYLNKTMESSYFTPSGMIPYNFYRKYNENRGQEIVEMVKNLMKKFLNLIYEGMVINGERMIKYGNWL